MEKPILFTTEMVKAILDGRKTVTRRMLKLPNYIKQNQEDAGLYTLYAEGCCYENQRMEELTQYLSSPCKVDDVLYVRETWNCLRTGNKKIGYTTIYWYKADDTNDNPDDYWRPSIHMPKEAARIFLRVTDVKVERLQNITEEDAKREGGIDNRGFIHSPDNVYEVIHSAREHFKQIWNCTIKKKNLEEYGWDANPWVWVIEFERCGR